MFRLKTAAALGLAAALAANCTDEPTRPHLPAGLSGQVTSGSFSGMAFVSDRDGNIEIYVMNADGSAQTRLTNAAGADEAPSWSPDERRIAFTSDRTGNAQIYVMNADGSAVTRLTNNSNADDEPSWSPDGSRIAFTSTRSGTYQIYTMNADGSGTTRLTNNTHFDVAPSWSPDGRQIAFQSDRDGNQEIYVMNADGSGQTRLTNNASFNGFDGDPTWSPDGRRIAFTSTRDGGDYEVYVMNADGSGQTRLTHSPGLDGDPTWSTNGLQIAFTSGRDQNNEIYVMNADGSAQTRLTSTPSNDFQPRWSPAVLATSGALAFVTQPPASVQADVVVSPPVRVAVQDTLGNTVAGATNAVTVALGANPTGAVLLGTTTVGAVDGVATFADLRVDRPGSGYTLVARAAGLADATSASFDVVPSKTLGFVTPPPANVDANVALSPAVRVAVEDSAGNRVPGATDTVTLALGTNQTGALLQGTSTAVAVDGIATFADLRVDRPGSYTLVATATGIAGATSPAFAVHVTFAQVSAGYFHTCGVTTSGAAYCWGYNSSGQLGGGTATSSRSSPAPVAGGLAFTAVSAGGGFPFGAPGHTCGTTAGGAAYCWGYNASGQLGDGTTTNRTSPVPVSGGLSLATVGAGTSHTCAVTTGGEAYCWGANFRGQLGNGTTVVPSSSPVRVFGVLTFTAVDAGSAYSCGVATAGALACWGFNGDGELGDGTTADRTVPAPDLSPTDVASLSTGTYHACAVTTSAGAYCWGANTSGQLGDGTTVTRTSATPVAGGLGLAAVSAGYQHSCGVTPSGAAYCWGWNAYGQLGDGTTTTRPTAGLVAGGLTFKSVSAGVYHTCGVTTDGVAYCWGNNPFGALGNGTTTSSSTPVPVLQ